MNKGSKYKSGQRPTFRIWDNEKNDWFEPTYEGWDGKIEELLLSPTGDLTMRTFTDFKHESVFPERFEIVLDEPQKISWRKAISVLEHHFQCEIPINLDNVVKGYREMSGILNTVEFELSKRNSELTAKEFIFEALESKKHKVKVPAFVAEWIKKHCYMGKHVCLERFMCQYNNVELPTDLYNYYDSDKDGARDKVICAILDGYEVEEEPEWVVKRGLFYFEEFDSQMNGDKFGFNGDRRLAKAHHFSDKSKAEAVADLIGGEVKKTENDVSESGPF